MTYIGSPPYCDQELTTMTISLYFSCTSISRSHESELDTIYEGGYFNQYDLASKDFNIVEIKAYGGSSDKLEGRYNFYHHQSGCFSWYKDKISFEMDTPSKVTDLCTQNLLIATFQNHFSEQQEYFLDEETEKRIIGMLILDDNFREIILEKYLNYHFSAGSANRLFHTVIHLRKNGIPITIPTLMNYAGPWKHCPNYQIFDRSTFDLICSAVSGLSENEKTKTIARIEDFLKAKESGEAEMRAMRLVKYDYQPSHWGGENWRNLNI